MADKNQTLLRDLTQGSIVKNIFVYAWPLFIANSLQAIYNIVDMLIVGRVEGQIGLAAVSIGADILFLVTSLIMGFSSAGQVLIAQATGAGNTQRIKKLIGNMYTLSLIFAVIIGTACLLTADAFLRALNTPEVAYKDAKVYFLTCAVGGILFTAGYNITCAVLRGMGNSKQPCIFIAIASILNIVLDIWFVRYLGMGVFGAALATVIGQGLAFAVAIIYLYRNRDRFNFDFKLKSFVMDSATLSSLMRLGIPMSIQNAAVSISKLVLAAWINACGVIYTALAGVYNKVSMMINILNMSLTTSGSTIIGQNIGAEKYDRVIKTLIYITLFSLVICLVFIGFVLIYPTALFEMFTDDPEVINAFSILILPFVVSFIGVIGRSFSFSLVNGSGNSKLNLMIAIFDGIIARLAFAYYFGFVAGLSAQGFWLGDALAGNVPFFIGIFFYISKKWQRTSR